jgi:peptide deformylase
MPPHEQEVLLIGDPRLRIKSVNVDDVTDSTFMHEKDQLTQALAAFRNANGYGRAISAPQIGVGKRFIACNLGKGPFTIINPVISHFSEETFTLWVSDAH